MSDKLSTLSAAEIKEFDTRHANAIEKFKKAADNYHEYAAEFREVAKRELWRARFKTQEEWVAAIREGVGMSRSQFFKKVQAEEIRAGVIKKLQSPGETKLSKSLEKTVKNMGTKQLLALGKAPPEKRVEVVGKAVSHGPPTEAAIAATIKVQAMPKETVVTDLAGYQIPKEVLDFWERREEIQALLLTPISKAKTTLEKARQSDDPLYRRISQAAIDHLSRAYQFITDAKPYAVCLTCQGRNSSKCPVCRGTGLVCESMYAHKEAQEKRIMREKAYHLTAYATT